MRLGLYNNIKDELPKQFSVFQLMSILGVDSIEERRVRNILKQFFKQGYIRRISKNMYEKIK